MACPCRRMAYYWRGMVRMVRRSGSIEILAKASYRVRSASNHISQTAQEEAYTGLTH
jgi:hypothetical protein